MWLDPCWTTDGVPLCISEYYIIIILSLCMGGVASASVWLLVRAFRTSSDSRFMMFEMMHDFTYSRAVTVLVVIFSVLIAAQIQLGNALFKFPTDSTVDTSPQIMQLGSTRYAAVPGGPVAPVIQLLPSSQTNLPTNYRRFSIILNCIIASNFSVPLSFPCTEPDAVGLTSCPIDNLPTECLPGMASIYVMAAGGPDAYSFMFPNIMHWLDVPQPSGPLPAVAPVLTVVDNPPQAAAIGGREFSFGVHLSFPSDAGDVADGGISPWAGEAVDIHMFQLGSLGTVTLDGIWVDYLRANGSAVTRIIGMSEAVVESTLSNRILGIPPSAVGNLFSQGERSAAAKAWNTIVMPLMAQYLEQSVLSCLMATTHTTSKPALERVLLTNITQANVWIGTCLNNMTCDAGQQAALQYLDHTIGDAGADTATALLTATASLLGLADQAGVTGLWSSVALAVTSALQRSAVNYNDGDLPHLPLALVSPTRAFVNASGHATFDVRMAAGGAGVYIVQATMPQSVWRPPHSTPQLTETFVSSAPVQVSNLVLSANVTNVLLGDVRTVHANGLSGDACGSGRGPMPSSFVPTLVIVGHSDQEDSSLRMVWTCPTGQQCYTDAGSDTDDGGALVGPPAVCVQNYVHHPIISAVAANGSTISCADVHVRLWSTDGVGAPILTLPVLKQPTGYPTTPSMAFNDHGIEYLSPLSIRLLDGSSGRYSMRLYCNGLPAEPVMSFDLQNFMRPDLNQVSFIVNGASNRFWGVLLVCLVAVFPVLSCNAVNSSGRSSIGRPLTGFAVSLLSTVLLFLMANSSSDIGYAVLAKSRQGLLSALSAITGLNVGSIVETLAVQPFTPAEASVLFACVSIQILLDAFFYVRLLTKVGTLAGVVCVGAAVTYWTSILAQVPGSVLSLLIATGLPCAAQQLAWAFSPRMKLTRWQAFGLATVIIGATIIVFSSTAPTWTHAGADIFLCLYGPILLAGQFWHLASWKVALLVPILWCAPFWLCKYDTTAAQCSAITLLGVLLTRKFWLDYGAVEAPHAFGRAMFRFRRWLIAVFIAVTTLVYLPMSVFVILSPALLVGLLFLGPFVCDWHYQRTRTATYLSYVPVVKHALAWYALQVLSFVASRPWQMLVVTALCLTICLTHVYYGQFMSLLMVVLTGIASARLWSVMVDCYREYDKHMSQLMAAGAYDADTMAPLTLMWSAVRDVAVGAWIDAKGAITRAWQQYRRPRAGTDVQTLLMAQFDSDTTATPAVVHPSRRWTGVQYARAHKGRHDASGARLRAAYVHVSRLFKLPPAPPKSATTRSWSSRLPPWAVRAFGTLRSWARILVAEFVGVRSTTHVESPLQDPNLFFFPQRMLVAFAITMTLLAVFVFGVIVAVEWGAYWLQLALEDERHALDQYELTGASRDAFAGAGGTALRVIGIFFAQLEHMGLYPDLYVTIAYWSFLGAAVLSWMVVVAMCISMMIRYRRNIFRLRRGKYWFNPAQYNMALATRFIGYQAVHFVAAYLCCFGVLVMLALCIIIAVYVPAVARFWEFTVGLPLLFKTIPWLVFFLLLFGVLGWVFTSRKNPTRFYLRYTQAFTIFDYFSIFVYLVAGLVVVLVRVAMLPLLTLFTLWQLDSCVLSKDWEAVDLGYAAYTAALLLDHVYHNPVVCVIVDILGQDVMQRRRVGTSTQSSEAAPPRRSPSRFRWHLWRTLYHNPSLRLLRKHVLLAKAKQALSVHAPPSAVITSLAEDTHTTRGSTDSRHASFDAISVNDEQ